jgi:hypothetical protein
MRALVRTVDGVFEVDLDEEEVLGLTDAEVEPEPVETGLPLVVSAARNGSAVMALVDRRPPLAISNDAGRTTPSTPRATASISPKTAAASGGRSRRSSRRSKQS